MRTRWHSPFTPYLFLLPAAAILGVFFLGAGVQVIAFSFTRYTAFSGPDYVGLENYRRLLASDVFWLCLLNSFLYLLVTPVLIAISLAAAMVVHAELRLAKGLRLMLFLPVITPTVVAAVAWRILFNEESGLLNAALQSIGLPAIGWLSERPWTLVTAMIVTLWKGFGFYMMVFLAALVAVPRELHEAASLDGANRLQSFRVVTLPTLRPAIILVAVISSISALKVFDELFVTVRGVPITHQTVVPLIYRFAFEQGQYGLASALGILLFLAILAFSVTNLWLSRERTT